MEEVDSLRPAEPKTITAALKHPGWFGAGYSYGVLPGSSAYDAAPPFYRHQHYPYPRQTTPPPVGLATLYDLHVPPESSSAGVSRLYDRVLPYSSYTINYPRPPYGPYHYPK